MDFLVHAVRRQSLGLGIEHRGIQKPNFSLNLILSESRFVSGFSSAKGIDWFQYCGIFICRGARGNPTDYCFEKSDARNLSSYQ
jgi:hypothetical protein